MTPPSTFPMSFISFERDVSYFEWSMFSLSSVVRMDGQNNDHRFTQILSDAKFMLLYQISKVSDVNRAQENHRFGKLAQYSPTLFSNGWRRHGLTLVHDNFSFNLMSSWTDPCFQREILLFSNLQCSLQIHPALLLKLRHLHTRIGYRQTSRSKQQRPISVQRC